jgi:hypothetical protein
MQYRFRSSHIPIAQVNLGRRTYLIPDRANASFYTERKELERHLTAFSSHIVTERDAYSAPTISFIYYNTKDYWWLVCLYNNIVFPTKELHVGLEIRIPDFNQLETYMSANRIGGVASKVKSNTIQRI